MRTRVTGAGARTKKQTGSPVPSAGTSDRDSCANIAADGA